MDFSHSTNALESASAASSVVPPTCLRERRAAWCPSRHREETDGVQQGHLQQFIHTLESTTPLGIVSRGSTGAQERQVAWDTGRPVPCSPSYHEHGQRYQNSASEELATEITDSTPRPGKRIQSKSEIFCAPIRHTPQRSSMCPLSILALHCPRLSVGTSLWRRTWVSVTQEGDRGLRARQASPGPRDVRLIYEARSS